METRTVQAHLKARGWTQSDLAQKVGVSRQAVSQWFSGRRAEVRAKHLLAVARVLGVSAEQLNRPLPALGDRVQTTVLLWDGLYPDLDDFAVAVNRKEPAAIARLVWVHGLYAADRMVGPWVWQRFDTYKQHIEPHHRRSLAALVQWRKNQNPTQK